MRYPSPSKELQSLFNNEWKRAKRIGKPLFDGKPKPRFYVMNTLWRIHDINPWGVHFGGSGTLTKINGAWGSNDVIVVRSDLVPKQMVNTIRHEIVHTVYRNHKRQFKALLAGLNRQPHDQPSSQSDAGSSLNPAV